MARWFLGIGMLWFGSCSQGIRPEACQGTEDVNWLVGDWKMPDRDVLESWILLEDGRLLGTVSEWADGDTVVTERMTLQIEEGQGVLTAVVSGQNSGEPVPFVLTTCGEGFLVFDNPEHDFPQRIGYRRGPEHELEAWVEGDGRKMTFTYQRTIR